MSQFWTYRRGGYLKYRKKSLTMRNAGKGRNMATPSWVRRHGECVVAREPSSVYRLGVFDPSCLSSPCRGPRAWRRVYGPSSPFWPCCVNVTKKYLIKWKWLLQLEWNRIVEKRNLPWALGNDHDDFYRRSRLRDFSSGRYCCVAWNKCNGGMGVKI